MVFSFLFWFSEVIRVIGSQLYSGGPDAAKSATDGKIHRSLMGVYEGEPVRHPGMHWVSEKKSNSNFYSDKVRLS